MVPLSCFAVFLAVGITATFSTPVSYQYVKFISESSGSSAKKFAIRPPRSFAFSSTSNGGLWEDEILHSITNPISFERNRGHITPDFSNGLEHPDSFLLTGHAAHRAATILYGKPLFFSEIHHVQSLLRNQEQRKLNGLAGNKLGSLRPHSPFYRFKSSSFNYFR